MAEESVKRILLRGSRTSPLFASGQLNPTFPCKQVGDLPEQDVGVRGDPRHGSTDRLGHIHEALAPSVWKLNEKAADKDIWDEYDSNNCTEAAICYWRR